MQREREREGERERQREHKTEREAESETESARDRGRGERVKTQKECICSLSVFPVTVEPEGTAHYITQPFVIVSESGDRRKSVSVPPPVPEGENHASL